MVPVEAERFTVGVLVQTNFGGVLTMGGAPKQGNGSCMMIVATDAPLSGRLCQRLAERAVLGLGRTGSSYANESGDFAIAFSTAPSARVAYDSPVVTRYETVSTDASSALFEAVLECTEEAVYNSLLKATTVGSARRTVEAIPIDPLREIPARYGIR